MLGMLHSVGVRVFAASEIEIVGSSLNIFKLLEKFVKKFHFFSLQNTRFFVSNICNVLVGSLAKTVPKTRKCAS